MPTQIIIDGYNFIRQSGTLALLDARDLQEGREALLKLLTGYKRLKPHAVAVVFDGTEAPIHYQRHDRVGGVEIIFSAPGQTADRVIKNMAAKKREKAVIVSSDGEIAAFAESVGATTISSPEFEAKIAQAELLNTKEAGMGEEEALSGWRPGLKKKGPRRRLSKKSRQHRRKTRKL